MEWTALCVELLRKLLTVLSKMGGRVFPSYMHELVLCEGPFSK